MSIFVRLLVCVGVGVVVCLGSTVLVAVFLWLGVFRFVCLVFSMFRLAMIGLCRFRSSHTFTIKLSRLAVRP